MKICLRACAPRNEACHKCPFIYWLRVSLVGAILLILGIDKYCVKVACVFGFCLFYKTNIILQDWYYYFEWWYLCGILCHNIYWNIRSCKETSLVTTPITSYLKLQLNRIGKKWTPLSFLHFYHHTAIFLVCWLDYVWW